MRLFVDNLTNVDFSYLCPKRGLVGETWLASIALEGPQDEQGMICDFGRVKQHLRHWLDTEIDHRLLVPSQATAIGNLQNNSTIGFVWQLGEQRSLHIRSPAQAIALIPCDTITPDSLATWCIQQLQGDFGSEIEHIHLKFTAEPITGHYYHYSHGLKKHLGNCQRIAHGHRSTILIWRNGQLCERSMAQVAAQWRDIYIGTRSDLSTTLNDHYQFDYDAQQGSFHLTLPIDRCYLMDEDTTVENISRHLAETLKQQWPEDSFEVKAFEGIAKGAIYQL